MFVDGLVHTIEISAGQPDRLPFKGNFKVFHARVDFGVEFIWEASNVEIRRSVSAICENKPGQLQKRPTSWRGPVSSLLNSSSVRWPVTTSLHGFTIAKSWKANFGVLLLR